MGGPIKLDVLANVRGFQKGTDDAADALEEVADSLDDVTRDGDKAADRLERSFAELARDARKHGDDIGDGIRKGFKRAGEGADDFKQEAGSSIRETAASISSVTDGLDAVQEIAANAFVGFGPVGAGAGLVGALGLGLVTAEIQKQQEESDELKARLTSAYSEAAQAGRDYLDEAQIIAEVNSLLFDPARADEYKRLQEDAARIGLDVSTYTRAIAGDEDAINTALEVANRKRAERQDWADKNLTAERDTGTVTDAVGSAMDGIISKLETRKQLTDDNKAAAELALEVEKQIKDEQASGNADAAAAIDKRGEALQKYADAASKIPDPVLTPTLDTRGADEELSRFIAKPRSVDVSIFYRDGRGLFGG